MILVLVLFLSLGLHLLLGWQWTLFAGVIGGLFARRLGALVGAMGVGLAWALLLLFNYVVAPSETGRMIGLMGDLFGNLGSPVVVGTSILLGFVVGLLGGSIGVLIRGLFRKSPTRTNSAAPY